MHGVVVTWGPSHFLPPPYLASSCWGCSHVVGGYSPNTDEDHLWEADWVGDGQWWEGTTAVVEWDGGGRNELRRI